jgi:hypothetical protein
MSAAYVTQGDTPNCDACHTYYSERHCEDCNQYLCTWCNLDIHVPIGKRNHHRPRLYGTDKYAHLDGPALSSADQALADAESSFTKNRTAFDAQAENEAFNKYTFDPVTMRVNVTTEVFLDVSPEDGWDLVSVEREAEELLFYCCLLASHCAVSAARSVSLSAR